MITLITGTPGSGKTLYAVHMLIKQINDNPDRKIYSDIAGLKIEGILPVPEDWREAEDGSLLIYDECQYRPMFQRGRGRTKYQAVVDLTTHRHTGKDIWLITQSPIFLHTDVLAVVGEHLHIDRPMGAKLANVYKWRDAQQKPQGRTVKEKAENRSLFKYNKDLFNYYSSVDVDDDKANHKSLKVSGWIWIPILLGSIFFLYNVYGLYSFYKSKTVKSDNKTEVKPTKKTQYDEMIEQQNKENTAKDSTKASSQQPAPNNTPVGGLLVNDSNATQPNQEQLLYQKYLQPYTLEVGGNELVRPAIVAQMGNECIAYNQYGDKLNIDDTLCKSMLKEYGLKPKARQAFNHFLQDERNNSSNVLVQNQNPTPIQDVAQNQNLTESQTNTQP